MNKFMQKMKALKPTKRKLMQLYLALLFNANLKGFAAGRIYKGNSKVMCAPGINCYSCPGAITACPLGSFQGSFSADHSTIFYVGGILLLYCILFGRMICGWACPFGWIQELLYKIKTPKAKKSPVTRVLSFFKYVVLVFFVLVVPITYALRDKPVPGFCKYICPVGTIEGGLGLLSNKVNSSYFAMLGPIFTWKFMLMVSIVVASIFIFRVFCRFICPLGALYGLFNKISVFGMKVDEEKCTHCNLCVAHCHMDIKHVGDQECIACGECIDVCPTKAISWKGTKIFVKPNELPDDADQEAIEAHKKKQEKRRLITRICTTVVLMAVLIGTIAYYWVTTPPVKKPDSPAPNPSGPVQELVIGNQVGNLCPGYELDIVTGDGVSSEKIDPTKTGKITIINFWGTWCGPCTTELPYFDQIATDYADTVSVVAIHSYMGAITAPAYIKEHFPESKMIFAQDADNAAYFTTLGGADAYPYTLVLSEKGVISKIYVGPVHYEDLQKDVEALLNAEDTPSAPEGNTVGTLCYGSSLDIVTGDGVSSEKIDPTKTGKITVINFWGTWCGPCTTELPYFDQIATDYEETVSVVAIHSYMGALTAPAYIKEHFPDTKMVFAQDGENAAYFTMLGGVDAYPYTLILDETGVITKIYVGPVHYEDLQKDIEAILNR